MLSSFIKSSYSSHKNCFICKSKKFKLYTVKNQAIFKAYQSHHIFIKKDSRCCLKHLDDNGLINESEISAIKTKLIKIPNGLTNTLNYFSKLETNVFDKFNDVSSLDDKHCIKITGWNKCEFIRFSKYITSCNNTFGRSIEQLIAIYRFWLRKGIDQTSMALFKNNTSQQQISNYLSQIRNAIHKDFVPHFLGANKERDFYIKHNNITVNELHNLGSEDLAIFVDATYSRLEKSSNNNFQYLSWSQQKLDHLTKPFIICCADGYFIDCYGPFQANKNDASIFDYILKTERELLSILIPKKTYIFLDRGFRDIYQKLINEYSFIAKIPTCVQLNDENASDDEKEAIKSSKKRQLTRKQANEDRLVTKCRFIIEKQNGALKNFKALDNIRNTIAGHIQIDYRIACAMCNFLHKPCCPDGGGERSRTIAKRIKSRSNIKTNNLEFLLTKQLDTKHISPIQLNDISDFPKLSKSLIIDHILFGTYQYKTCLSYMGELVDNNVAYVVSNKLIKTNISQYKTIAVEITSRHKRTQIIKTSKKKQNKRENVYKNYYKVFLTYEQSVNNVEAVKEYICNCKSGKKSNGCCAHVATLIYYLSCGKYSVIKTPAEHLNKIFINMVKLERSNLPRHVKNKRNNNIFVEQSIAEKNTDNCYIYSNSDKTEQNSYESKESSLSAIVNNEINIYKENPTLEEFRSHIPKWGGEISYWNTNIFVSNTCTIDYFLFALWVLYKRNVVLIESMPKLSNSDIIKVIIVQIDNLNWNKAKELWILKVMKYNKKPIRNSISMFGSEDILFLKYINHYQMHNLFQRCNSQCQKNGIEIKKNINNIFFKKLNGNIQIYSFFSGVCSYCNCQILCDIKFINKTNFIFIESANNNIFVNELPKTISINDLEFKFLYSTVHENNHFLGIYDINDNLYVVNDIGQSMTLLDYRNGNSVYKMPTSVSFYYLK